MWPRARCQEAQDFPDLRIPVRGPFPCQGVSFPPVPQAKSQWPKGDMFGPTHGISFRACGARPSAKGQSRAGMPFRGKPGYGAKDGFLGGTHSVRPHCEALLMPRPFITQDGWPDGRWAMTTCLGQAGAFLAGVRSPPLRGGYPSSDGLAGKTRGWREGRPSRRYCVGLSSLLGLGRVGSLVMKRWVEGLCRLENPNGNVN